MNSFVLSLRQLSFLIAYRISAWLYLKEKQFHDIFSMRDKSNLRESLNDHREEFISCTDDGSAGVPSKGNPSHHS